VDPVLPRGKPERESSRSKSKTEAKRPLNLKEAAIAKGIPVTSRIGQIKFAEMAELEINDYKKKGRRSLKDLLMRLRLHILPFFGQSRASSITAAHIGMYIAKRQEEKAKPGTINRELTIIKRAYSIAVKNGDILTVPHIEMLKENNIRKGFFERDQFESFCRHLPQDVQPLVTFAYITGWRIRSEVRFLQWSQVDFRQGRRIPHDFRRSAVRTLVRVGIPETVATKMTGHKTRSVFERYNIVSQGDLFDGARKLDLARQTQQAQSEISAFADSAKLLNKGCACSSVG
jgi:integrase